jgi:MoaA/NifB/PqqE/SkfB family radical SAM enzyme
MMSEATFCRLVKEVREVGAYRVALVGNGEPTLHPRFADYIGRLSAAAPWVSLTTNGQCISGGIAIATLNSARQINVTVDGASKVEYEERRIGGSFERLLENLRRLLALKRSIGSLALINVRVMIGRADQKREREILHFWRPYSDVVSKQYILDFGGDRAWGFTPISKGRCTLPFKKLDVHWNGVVNLCGYSWIQTGHSEGVVLGNISDNTLLEMWNSSVMRQYREGHRRGMEAMIPICRGCPGRT